MADDTPQAGTDVIATDHLSELNGAAITPGPTTPKAIRVKPGFGLDGVFRDVSVGFPLPTSVVTALPAGAAAIGTVALNAALPAGAAAIGTVGVTSLPALVAGAATVGNVGLVAGAAAIGTVAVTALPALAAGAAAIGTVAVNAALPAGLNRIGDVGIRASDLHVTTTAAAGAAITLTLPAPAAGQFHYIVGIYLALYSSAARTGVAAPILLTTTNLPGSPVYLFGTAGAIGTTERLIRETDSPVKSSVAATATTFVAPIVTGGLWRLSASYYTGT